MSLTAHTIYMYMHSRCFYVLLRLWERLGGVHGLCEDQMIHLHKCMPYMCTYVCMPLTHPAMHPHANPNQYHVPYQEHCWGLSVKSQGDDGTHVYDVWKSAWGGLVSPPTNTHTRTHWGILILPLYIQQILFAYSGACHRGHLPVATLWSDWGSPKMAAITDDTLDFAGLFQPPR